MRFMAPGAGLWPRFLPKQVSDFNLSRLLGGDEPKAASSTGGGPGNPIWLVGVRAPGCILLGCKQISTRRALWAWL